MAPKSERFEMRLDEDILGRVDDWREKQGDELSRAEAMRRLIELGLERNNTKTVKFSDGEKLLAVMMGDLYKHLSVKGDIDPEFVSEVISGGHYWAPTWEMPRLFHQEEDDPRDVRLVTKVLDMWTFVERAHERLSAADKAKVDAELVHFGKIVPFPGFDGNEEPSHYSIALFLIDKMNRFATFKDRDLNSHYPMIAAYAEMLRVFEPMRANLVGMELSASQLVAIHKAQMGGN